MEMRNGNAPSPQSEKGFFLLIHGTVWLGTTNQRERTEPERRGDLDETGIETTTCPSGTCSAGRTPPAARHIRLPERPSLAEREWPAARPARNQPAVL